MVTKWSRQSGEKSDLALLTTTFETPLHNLSQLRPVFHNGAEFQHALAWELNLAFPEAQLMLEVQPIPAERMYV